MDATNEAKPPGETRPASSDWQPPSTRPRAAGFVQPTLLARPRDQRPLIDEAIKSGLEELTTVLGEIARYDLNADRFGRDANQRATEGY
jgi:hypothetical protein